MPFHVHKQWGSYFFGASLSLIALLKTQVKGASLPPRDSKQGFERGCGGRE